MNPNVDTEQSTPSEWNADGDRVGDGCRHSVGGDAAVRADLPVDALYEGSDGRYYTDWQLTRRLRTDRWSLCIRQRDLDRHLVETSDGQLLLLTPTDDLPEWAELRIDERGARVVDTRGPLPE